MREKRVFDKVLDTVATLPEVFLYSTACERTLVIGFGIDLKRSFNFRTTKR